MRNVNFFIVLVLLMQLLTVSAQDTLSPGVLRSWWNRKARPMSRS